MSETNLTPITAIDEATPYDQIVSYMKHKKSHLHETVTTIYKIFGEDLKTLKPILAARKEWLPLLYEIGIKPDQAENLISMSEIQALTPEQIIPENKLLEMILTPEKTVQPAQSVKQVAAPATVVAQPPAPNIMVPPEAVVTFSTPASLAAKVLIETIPQIHKLSNPTVDEALEKVSEKYKDMRFGKDITELLFLLTAIRPLLKKVRSSTPIGDDLYMEAWKLLKTEMESVERSFDLIRKCHE